MKINLSDDVAVLALDRACKDIDQLYLPPARATLAAKQEAFDASQKTIRWYLAKQRLVRLHDALASLMPEFIAYQEAQSEYGESLPLPCLQGVPELAALLTEAGLRMGTMENRNTGETFGDADLKAIEQFRLEASE